MAFINHIIEYLNDASDFFYELYHECFYAYYIPSVVANLFYEICLIFNRLAWEFYDFGEWVEDVAGKVRDVLSWSNIKNLIRDWLPNIEELASIAANFWGWVRQEINDWWRAASSEVLDWVDDAKQWAKSLIDQTNIWLGNLQAAWDSFKESIPSIEEILWWFTDWWSHITTNLNYWWQDRLGDVSSLIDTAFLEREAFWSGWQDWRAPVIEFFSNPFEWIKLHVIEPIVDDFNQGFDRGMKGEEK